jgi:hypothetical protein
LNSPGGIENSRVGLQTLAHFARKGDLSRWVVSFFALVQATPHAGHEIGHLFQKVFSAKGLVLALDKRQFRWEMAAFMAIERLP